MTLSKKRAGDFYEEHKGKFFYNRLVTYMSSGPMQALILAKEGAIADWRTLMGPTKVFKTRFDAPLSIRGRFGLTDTRNCSHGSDSPQTAAREINFFFPEFSANDFYKYEEEELRAGNATFDEENFVHRVIVSTERKMG